MSPECLTAATPPHTHTHNPLQSPCTALHCRHNAALREAAHRAAAALGGASASVQAIMGRVTSHPATSYLVTGEKTTKGCSQPARGAEARALCIIIITITVSTNQPTNPQTGSSDGHIRYWDFVAPARCFTVSGLRPGQPTPQYTAAGGGLAWRPCAAPIRAAT